MTEAFNAAFPRACSQVVRVRPNDKDAKMKYQECNKIVKQKAFERAIASDETKKSVVDSLDIENMSKYPVANICSSEPIICYQTDPFVKVLALNSCTEHCLAYCMFLDVGKALRTARLLLSQLLCRLPSNYEPRSINLTIMNA